MTIPNLSALLSKVGSPPSDSTFVIPNLSLRFWRFSSSAWAFVASSSAVGAATTAAGAMGAGMVVEEEEGRDASELLAAAVATVGVTVTAASLTGAVAGTVSIRAVGFSNSRAMRSSFLPVWTKEA